MNSLQQRLQAGIPIENLDDEYLKDLKGELGRFTYIKASILKSLSCTLKLFFRKDRQQRLKERAVLLYSASLDI